MQLEIALHHVRRDGDVPGSSESLAPLHAPGGRKGEPCVGTAFEGERTESLEVP